MNKQLAYSELVKKRKQYRFESEGIVNPHEIENGKYDCDHLNPWALWQNSLDAKILLVGQDWGDDRYFLENRGKDNDKSGTNQNLIKLFAQIGIDIGLPGSPKDSKVYFTNAVLGIKKDGMASKIKSDWYLKTADLFIKPLIDIINPPIIIAMGSAAYFTIAKIYGLRKKSLSKVVDENPISLNDGKKLFVMYHCSALGTANRKLELQKKDWKKIQADFQQI